MRFCPPARSHRRRRARAEAGPADDIRRHCCPNSGIWPSCASPRTEESFISSPPRSGWLLATLVSLQEHRSRNLPALGTVVRARSSAPATRPRAARRGARSSSAHPVPYPLPASGPADAAARSSRPATSREHGIMRVWTCRARAPRARASLLCGRRSWGRSRSAGASCVPVPGKGRAPAACSSWSW